jgi:mono/diheme cytochrome c family protein
MSRLVPSFVLSLCTLFALEHVAHADDAAKVYGDRVMPVLETHCTSCHGGAKPEAKFNLSGARTLEQLQAEGLHWFRVLERIEEGSMPPKDEPRLTPAERQVVAGWARGELSTSLRSVQLREGRSKLRRLTRTEYANTIQDIFGIRPPVVRDLPVDGRVDGFDKVSAALPLSSAHAGGYLKIAEDILDRFPLSSPQDKGRGTFRLWAAESQQSKGHILELADGWKVSFNTDTTSVPLNKEVGPDKQHVGFPSPSRPGVHHLRMNVYAYQTDKPIPFGIYVGHVWSYPQILELTKVLEAPPGKPTILETDVYLRTGRDSDGPSDDGIRLIPFGLGVPVPKNTQASACKGPGLAVQWVDVTEPELPSIGDRLLYADMTPDCRDVFTNAFFTVKNTKLSRAEIATTARKILERVGLRLFRRDLTEAELGSIMASFNSRLDAGVPLRTALLGELTGLMTAPDFLCLIEEPGPLNNFALASRLSYFLWDSAPDDELLTLARQGKLTDSKILRDQTDRMLKDPKSQRFVKDFTDQWLGLWGIDNTTPDKDLYPEYDDVLKISSAMETQATFRRILDENRSVRDFVAPKWALVNQWLAKHYDLPAVAGFDLREVPLPADSPFGGLWTQSATMKVTANGTSTSPVKRGVWVAERLLGITIPPPPPNVQPVNPDTRGAKTLREQLALHRSQGSCNACHAKFDPYGFALESFDVTGAFRTKYRRGGLPVDPSGATPDGVAFKGVQDLRWQLAKSPERLAFGVTRHLLTYSTGAPTNALDRQAIEQIIAQAKEDDYGLKSLVHGVVQSDLFRTK